MLWTPHRSAMEYLIINKERNMLQIPQCHTVLVTGFAYEGALGQKGCGALLTLSVRCVSEPCCNTNVFINMQKAQLCRFSNNARH